MYEPHIIEEVKHNCMNESGSENGSDSSSEAETCGNIECDITYSVIDKYNTNKTNISYDEASEMEAELATMNYNINKDTGDWISAKNIISKSLNNKEHSEFFVDYLESLFKINDDCFENIRKVIYTTDICTSYNSIYEFSEKISKYVIDNLKIAPFRANGYLFKTSENVNKWHFKIVVITTKNIYSANRHIDDKTIGFY